MNTIASRLRERTESFLSWRADRITRRKERVKKKHPVVDWLESFLWAACVVLIINQYFLQAYRIPTGSMIPTLLIGDNLFVNKIIYGPELLPGIGKLPGFKGPERGEMIIFENPDYISKGALYTLVKRLIYMLTLSLVDIERIQSGEIPQELYVKRAIGLSGDQIRYTNGRVYVLPAGGSVWLNMDEFREEYDIDFQINRLVDPSTYPALRETIRLNTWGDHLDADLVASRFEVLSSELRSTRNEDNDIVSTYDRFQGSIDLDRTRLSLHPDDSQLWTAVARQMNGWYVPEFRILPMGDNRDDSYDGRYFGPVLKENILGRPLFRFWPLSRIGLLR